MLLQLKRLRPPQYTCKHIDFAEITLVATDAIRAVNEHSTLEGAWPLDTSSSPQLRRYDSVYGSVYGSVTKPGGKLSAFNALLETGPGLP